MKRFEESATFDGFPVEMFFKKKDSKLSSLHWYTPHAHNRIQHFNLGGMSYNVVFRGKNWLDRTIYNYVVQSV